MAGELTYPILPCPHIDEAIAFYEALGFERTYRQVRPNPYAVVAYEDLTIHLAGIDGFDPATSYRQRDRGRATTPTLCTSTSPLVSAAVTNGSRRRGSLGSCAHASVTARCVGFSVVDTVSTFT